MCMWVFVGARIDFEIIIAFLVRTLKLKKGLFFEFNAPTIRKDEFSIL